MTPNGNRGVLTAIWFGSFFAALGIIVELWITGEIHDEVYSNALKLLSATYSPYLAGIGLFFWERRKEQRVARTDKIRGALALASSAVWNGLVVVPLVPLLFHRGSLPDALDTIATVGRTLSWLVAGAIAYYFVAPVESGAGEPGGGAI
jgi:hypothetical protein